jgi:hypothetical protein
MDIVIGLFGGLAASLVASLVFAFDDSIPFPVSLALGRLLGARAENYYVGFLGTFAYGLPAGMAYVYVFSVLLVAGVPSLLGTLVCATVWTVLLTGLFSALVGERQSAEYRRYLFASHLLYGLVLAGFVMLGPTDPTATVGPVGGY